MSRRTRHLLGEPSEHDKDHPRDYDSHRRPPAPKRPVVPQNTRPVRTFLKRAAWTLLITLLVLSALAAAVYVTVLDKGRADTTTQPADRGGFMTIEINETCTCGATFSYRSALDISSEACVAADIWRSNHKHEVVPLPAMAQAPEDQSDEPTHIGAKVRDHEGDTWTRLDDGRWAILEGTSSGTVCKDWALLAGLYGPLELVAS